MSEHQGASERLARLLALVPYLLARPGARVEQVAQAFGIDENRLVDDLQLLFVCGLPGYLPDDLIEASFEGGVIHLGNADAIARPLRLGADEALALLVGLRSLATIPELLPAEVGSDALDRAMVKLEQAAGEAASAAQGVTVAPTTGDEEWLPLLRRALETGHRLHLRYYSAGRDAVTERDVDPMRLLVVEGHSYLEGWCRRVEDVRLFRLDRVVRADLLDVAAEVPEGVEPRKLDGGLWQPGESDVTVTLELEPNGRWVAEYYPCERVEELGGGRLQVDLRTPQTGWVVRLLLRLAGSGRVLAPPELAAEVAAAADEALAAYS